uniref:Uncharacterized protein n=1 Tax=Romanomermis culicivorax TaxID=13658 RepID=A0A915HZK1_ROMCU
MSKSMLVLVGIIVVLPLSSTMEPVMINHCQWKSAHNNYLQKNTRSLDDCIFLCYSDTKFKYALIRINLCSGQKKEDDTKTTIADVAMYCQQYKYDK